MAVAVPGGARAQRPKRSRRRRACGRRWLREHARRWAEGRSVAPRGRATPRCIAGPPSTAAESARPLRRSGAEAAGRRCACRSPTPCEPIADIRTREKGDRRGPCVRAAPRTYSRHRRPCGHGQVPSQSRQRSALAEWAGRSPWSIPMSARQYRDPSCGTVVLSRWLSLCKALLLHGSRLGLLAAQVKRLCVRLRRAGGCEVHTVGGRSSSRGPKSQFE